MMARWNDFLKEFTSQEFFNSLSWWWRMWKGRNRGSLGYLLWREGGVVDGFELSEDKG